MRILERFRFWRAKRYLKKSPQFVHELMGDIAIYDEAYVRIERVDGKTTVKRIDPLKLRIRMVEDGKELQKELIEEYGEDGCYCHPEITKLIKLMEEQKNEKN